MSQSGAVQPVQSRRHRPEMNQNNTNEPITAVRFGETEWEARDVCVPIKKNSISIYVTADAEIQLKLCYSI